MNAADLETLIGALLMVGVRGGSVDDEALRRDLEACAAARVGGVILFDVDAQSRQPRNIRSPDQTRALGAAIHAALGEDSLVCVDQEGGAVARLRADLGFIEHRSGREFAREPLDARDNCAKSIASQLRSLGIDCNLAPCVDVASQPGNAVVVGSERCFSSDSDVVIACAAAVIRAHRSLGVLSCVKHFPGHGCSIDDSHRALPDITETFNASRDLAPYRTLLRGPQPQRPDMVMTAHLLDRNVDAEFPASLSAAHTGGALRERLGWDGVIVTDSLDMGAISSRWSAEEAAILALNAGADFVMHAFNPAFDDQPHPAPALAQAIRAALERGEIAGGVDRLKASADRLRRMRQTRATARQAAPTSQ